MLNKMNETKTNGSMMFDLEKQVQLNEKIWGFIDCSDLNECLEALFYIIIVLTFLVLVLIASVIFILVKLRAMLKSNESKNTSLSSDSSEYLTDLPTPISSLTHINEGYDDDLKIRNKAKSKSNWKLHKKRSLTFQNEEVFRREPTPDYDQHSMQKSQSQVYKFAYVDPDDYIENYLKKRQLQDPQSLMHIPRIQTPVHILPNKLKLHREMTHKNNYNKRKSQRVKRTDLNNIEQRRDNRSQSNNQLIIARKNPYLSSSSVEQTEN